MTAPHPLVRFTNELMTLTGDLDQTTAADFVRRVYEAGRAEGERRAAEDPSPGGER
ncbi:hypothetical protein [Peterkaempfera griseoplana]|uniref:hypothetical protein n=1 Tax=Peterkaempfera griseoplana TaxID=66896 RepID=UPI000A6A09FE|nr:hypothetical protein [Peterkaempfera griseoplana]